MGDSFPLRSSRTRWLGRRVTAASGAESTPQTSIFAPGGGASDPFTGAPRAESGTADSGRHLPQRPEHRPRSVPPVPCSQTHLVEITGTAMLSGVTQFPSTSGAMQSAVGSQCGALATRIRGRHAGIRRQCWLARSVPGRLDSGRAHHFVHGGGVRRQRQPNCSDRHAPRVTCLTPLGYRGPAAPVAAQHGEGAIVIIVGGRFEVEPDQREECDRQPPRPDAGVPGRDRLPGLHLLRRPDRTGPGRPLRAMGDARPISMPTSRACGPARARPATR